MLSVQSSNCVHYLDVRAQLRMCTCTRLCAGLVMQFFKKFPSRDIINADAFTTLYLGQDEVVIFGEDDDQILDINSILKIKH